MTHADQTAKEPAAERPMLKASMRIHVRDPEQADNLIPGVVQEILGENHMVRFLQPVTFPAGVKTTALFHDENNCFTSVPCQMVRMFSKGNYPTGALVLEGEAQTAESRTAFRVDTLDRGITATVNGLDSGEIANLSSGGVALILDVESYENKQWIDVLMVYDGTEHAGRMQVRSQSQEKDGRFRYGLMADPDEADMISQLSRISDEIHAARVNGAKHAEASSEKPKSQTNQFTEQQQRIQRPGAKRQHQRTAWPGMAKVYVREENNLRVLSVETADLSRGGISFYSPQYIYEGSEVLYEKPIEGGFFRVMIQVRNVQVMERGRQYGQHRIGGRFLGAPMQGGQIPERFDASHAA